MKPRRLICVAGCITAILVFPSCVVAPVLSVPDDSAVMCAGIFASQTEAYWFGVPISNSGQRAIALKAVRLGEQDHVLLEEAFAVPPVQQADGTSLGVGIMSDPATDTPDLWAGRQPVDGYMIPPDTTIHLALALSRDASETGRVHSQVITYRVDGELRDRQVTSRLGIVLNGECDILDEDT